MQKQKSFLAVWLLLGTFCLLFLLSLAAWRTKTQAWPENVGRTLSQEEQNSIIADNSPLTQYVKLSPNADFPREGKIQKITVHHMAGTISMERLGDVFANPGRRASSNYAIDIDGNVALYVEECNRAWTSSSPENDNLAVTIEVANDENGGQWHVSDESYAALIHLCVDICKRNGIDELVWTGDENGSLTIHKFFNSDTECPGPYLESMMPQLAEEVTRQLEDQRGGV